MSLLMGARGAGALIGPLISGRVGRQRQSRLRTGILVGFLLASAGYLLLGLSKSLALAVAAVIVAHAGSSTNWVFSTTLLQIYTTDRFRGRVFAADYGLCMLGYPRAAISPVSRSIGDCRCGPSRRESAW